MSYDPTIGRWLEEDPIGFAGGTANLYGYVGNDPTNATDPSGLLEVDDNPKNPSIAKLRDVNAIMEYIIDKAVWNAKTHFPDEPAKGVAAVYAALAKDNLVQRTTFETELETLLSRPDVLRKKGQSSYKIPFAQSRYGKVPVTPPAKDGKLGKRPFWPVLVGARDLRNLLP